MDFAKFGDAYYVRLDRGDEIVESLLELCRAEQIESATFSGIGGCGEAEIQVFSPETGTFSTKCAEGVLELVTITGSVFARDDGSLAHHAHALFAYHEGDEQRIAAGHLKSTTVLYTAELELRPVTGGCIRAVPDPETGTDFWAF